MTPTAPDPQPDQTTALLLPSSTPPTLPTLGDPAPLAGIITAWLDEKLGRSQSQRTRQRYQQILTEFRTLLQQRGLDLDTTSDPRLLATALQAYQHGPRSDGTPAAASTKNQRLAVVSSFYAYAITHDYLHLPNPAAKRSYSPVTAYAGARALPQEVVAQTLASPLLTLADYRNRALLLLALSTGRRSAELQAMDWDHLTPEGAVLLVRFPRCKRGKVMSDELIPAVRDALLAYKDKLVAAGYPSTGPVWIGLSYHKPRQRLHWRGIQEIVKKLLGTSKVHALRHTFAQRMRDAGAPLEVIGAKLGHSSLATTQRYLDQLRSATNEYGDQLLAALTGQH